MRRERLVSNVLERGLEKWLVNVRFVRVCPRAKPHFVLRGC
jgi:hypothetical protein